MGIVDEYLFYHEKYEEKYGSKSLVLMQVGSFMEMYCTDDRGYNLTEVSDLLNIVKTKKDKSDDETSIKNPYMMGFPLAAMHKFIKILIDDGFTLVVIEQVTPPPEPRREVTGIYSPGTYINECNSPDSNNIVCLYIEDEIQKDGTTLMCIGMSVVDLSTGKNSVYESYGISDDEKVSLDEASRFINSYSPKEIMIYRKDLDNKFGDEVKKVMSKDKLILYLELESKNCHYFNKINKNFFKLSYQTEFLSKIFEDTGMLQPIEYLSMEKMSYARISYLCLLDFSYQHNENIINSIYKPEIFQNSKHLILGNNAIYQLNVFKNDSFSGFNKQFKCMFDVVNNTTTAMGRRYLQSVITTPLVSPEVLNSRYDCIEEAMKKDLYIEMQEGLKGIMDLERLHRKLSLKMLHPWEFYTLLKSYDQVKEVFKLIKKTKAISLSLPEKLVMNQLNKLITKSAESFEIDELKKYNLNDISNSFMKIGVDKHIDKIQKKIDNNMDFMDNLCEVLSSYIFDTTKFKKNNSDDLKIKVHRNDREGYFLQLTALRAKSLKANLKDIKKLRITDKYELNITDLVFKPLSKGGTKIFFDDLSAKSNEVIILRETIMSQVKEVYLNTLDKFYKDYKGMFKKISDFISLVDFIKSSARTAKLYNYCKPKIVTNKKSNKSFVTCTQLRHPIIERISEDVEYVPHDISLGKDLDGMLVYGINSAGKSSMMKALGLSVIMAQSGMFVPATSYEYSPYHSMFARITASDNIFKGLSSFALEMVELRAILKRTGPNTLVIGDEVCRGTEHISGNSLVAATLIKLADAGSSFIFATHLHAIADMDRIKNLKNVKSFHLSVEFDKEKDSLIFDRLLKPGSGSSVYGITVAKYIIHDNEFMKLAQEIKNEIIESPNVLLKDKQSRYNSKVYVDSCGVCEKRKDILGYYETHHINHQKDCDEGFVKSKPHVKKNDKSNLVPLCEVCHTRVHNGSLEITGYVETSRGVKLKYLDLELDKNKPKKIKKTKTKESVC
jgi:DNA mismatch repair protein MutS